MQGNARKSPRASASDDFLWLLRSFRAVLWLDAAADGGWLASLLSHHARIERWIDWNSPTSIS